MKCIAFLNTLHNFKNSIWPPDPPKLAHLAEYTWLKGAEKQAVSLSLVFGTVTDTWLPISQARYRDWLPVSQARYGDWLPVSEADYGNWLPVFQNPLA